jgi:diacylglycerol kinase
MIESFYHAFHGIWIGLKEERNVRIHFVSAFAVVAVGLWLNVSLTEWASLAMAIGLVLTTEFLNTALEHWVDVAARGEWHESAKYAKDTAAAAVLCASTVAVVVGSVVFVPRLLRVFHLQ